MTQKRPVVFVYEDNQEDYRKIYKSLENTYEIVPSFDELSKAHNESKGLELILQYIDKKNSNLKLILFDLFIKCDCQSPNSIPSIDIIKRIRQHGNSKNSYFPSFIPIIIYSGVSNPDIFNRALKAGADSYIQKQSNATNQFYLDFQNKLNSWIDYFNYSYNSFKRFVPDELKNDVVLFRETNRDISCERTAFIMTSFKENHKKIAECVKKIIKSNKVKGIVADQPGGFITSELWKEIKIHMYSCDIGIAIYKNDTDPINENLQDENSKSTYINPNMSMEVGFMMALQKEVLIIKDDSIKNLPVDISDQIYIEMKDNLNRKIRKYLNNRI